MRRAFTGVAAALALLAPGAAQAEPILHWIKCPSCESTGNSTYGDIYHTFTVATAGDYDFWGEATSEGNFTFYLYNSAPGIGDTDPAAGFFATFNFDSGVDPHVYIQTLALPAGQIWVGADGQCVKPGAGCNVNLIVVDEGVIPPETVPEPATMLLLGSGLVGMMGAVRRRRKQ